MARPGLQRNRKWPRLVRAIGSEALARGSLELLWDVAYENGDDYLGDATDVELAAKWQGEPGKLTKALLEAGGDGEPGFIEELRDRPGRYMVHDLWDHAPDYVRKRRSREAERKAKGAELRTLSGQRPVSNRRTDDSERRTDDDDRESAPNGRPRAPTPAPAPTPEAEKHAAAAARVRDERQAAKPPSRASARARYSGVESVNLGWEAESEKPEAPPTETAPESPGAGGGHRTGPEDDAARANAASGGKRPAARDGGDAAAPGIGAEPRGAAGPARRGPVVDDIPHPPLQVYDLAGGGLGPLGAEFKRLAEEGIRRPLAAASADKRAKVADMLERDLGDESRVSGAAAMWVAAENAREGSGAPKTVSISGAALMLHDLLAVRDSDPVTAIRKACPLWASILDEVRNLPPDNGALGPGVFESLFLTLRPELVDRELVLTAQDVWHQHTIEDLYLSGIEKAVRRRLGEKATTRVIAAPAPAAAGGAR